MPGMFFAIQPLQFTVLRLSGDHPLVLRLHKAYVLSEEELFQPVAG